MGLLFRGAAWFTAYVVLAALPLAIAALVDPFAVPRPPATEVSAGLGLVAFALLAMQFTLVSRLRSASRPFGTDALMQFHRQLGIAALAFALLHPLLLADEGIGFAAWSPFTGSAATQSGAIALWAALLIGATSLVRRRLRLPYPAWQATHLGGALLVIGAMLWHVLAVSGYTAQPAMQGLLTGYALLALLALAHYRVLGPLRRWRQPWRVVANRDVGGDTRVLALRPEGHPGIRFEPGQFAWLTTTRTPFALEQHPLTIASSPEAEAGELEFAIKALGDWSGETVPGLANGTRVWVDGPYGVFTPERAPGQGLVLIAGGIGISPMRSMLLAMRDRGDRRHVLLLYAARDLGRTVFADELAELRGRIALEVVHVLERPRPGAPGEHGRIDAELLRRYLPAFHRHYQYFVCGPPPMLEALERLLPDLGIPAERIHTERFDIV